MKNKLSVLIHNAFTHSVVVPTWLYVLAMLTAGAMANHLHSKLKQMDTMYTEEQVYTMIQEYEGRALEATIEHEEQEWNDFIDALIFVESEGDPKAIGDGKKAVGVLQIHPCYLDTANRIAGYRKFSLADRYSWEKSIEIFNIVNEFMNPQRDFSLALKIHNCHAPLDYHKKVIQQMDNIQECRASQVEQYE